MWLTVSKDCSAELCQHHQNLQNQDHEKIFQLNEKLFIFASKEYFWIFQSNKISAAFELSFETHFAINMPSAARLLVHCRWKFFLRIEKFFVFCDVILSISNTPFGNSIQRINKTWISFGHNMEKHNVDEFNSPWEKNCFAFSSWFTTLQSQ